MPGQAWFRVTLDPTFDEEGHVTGGVAVWAEITRKHLEQSLHRREQEFRSLAETVPDVVARFDRDLKHVYINRRIESVTGLPAKTFLGKSNRDLGMPEPLAALWEKAAARSSPKESPRLSSSIF